MRDCANVNVRELLPDLLHDRLPAAQRVEVERHVAACADCRSELAILRRILASAAAPRVDVVRIAAAIPPYRPVSAWRRATAAPQLRVAAAIVLLAGSWAVLWSTRTPDDAGRRVAQTPIPTPPTVLVESIAPTPRVQRPPVGPSRGPTELAVGDSFHDVSDSELRALLDELVSLEAVTPTEAEVELPSPGRSGA
ncbi:MAG TPA: zf-HC2 domain-containing protein [Gemmatimonadaceae bacterium]|nr:zf-HC2 domain-containing protein [Gemmatimonadaceae bacterium]